MKYVSSFLISSVLFAPAIFAEVSYKGELLPVAPFNWTGFYGGLNLGLVNQTLKITDDDAASFMATIEQDTNPKFSGGFQIGYRYQIDLTRVSGVYGLELSANFSNADFSKIFGSPFALYQLDVDNTLKTVCLFDAIAGIAAHNTFLFISGGLSWVRLTGSATNLNSIAFFNGFNLDKKELGTVVGGGIEYAFNDRYSARIKVDVINPHTYTKTDNTGNEYEIANNIVQATFGINYKIA